MNNKTPIILGIIVEFNPFHYGHAHFINECQTIKPDLIIAITSTSFSMRGEVALIDKFQKTKLMLKSKIDLVLELPYLLGTQSADFFAQNSVKILSQFGITHLAFGVEDNNINKLYELNDIINNSSFIEIFKKVLLERTSYKKTFNKTLNKLNVSKNLIQLFNEPNITLALQYLNAINKTNDSITVIPIKRIGTGYHDLNLKGEIASAKAIRNRLKNAQTIDNLLPFPQHEYHFIDQKQVEETLLLLLRYQFTLTDNFNKIFGFSEGIENYLKKHLTNALNYQDLLEKLKNKRYSISRLERLFTYLLLHINKDINLSTDYFRVLGFNHKGEEYLSKLPKDLKKKIITSLKNVTNEIAKIELNATKLYGILTNQPNLFFNEYLIPIKERMINNGETS